MRFSVLMCVKDEVDIIQYSLSHWLGLGASAFYICDRQSIDGTWEILQRWKADRESEGVSASIHLEQRKQLTFDNHVVINEFARMSQDDEIYWMFPADADEFLRLRHRYDLVIINEKYQGLAVGLLDYYDILDVDGVYRKTKHTHKKVFGKFPKGISPNISIGNHEASPSIRALSLIEHDMHYDHFFCRSFEQFTRKITNISCLFNGTIHPRGEHFEKITNPETGYQYAKEIYQKVLDGQSI